MMNTTHTHTLVVGSDLTFRGNYQNFTRLRERQIDNLTFIAVDRSHYSPKLKSED